MYKMYRKYIVGMAEVEDIIAEIMCAHAIQPDSFDLWTCWGEG